jgi:hypothetical protein
MARPARIDLRLFQQELATRLASKTTAQVESSRLGLSCVGERWLIRLADAAEVVAVPPFAAVPLTQRWFLGLANIRGNLYSVVDLAGFLGRETVVPHGTSGQARLILFGPRAGDMNVGVVGDEDSVAGDSFSRGWPRSRMRPPGMASAGPTRTAARGRSSTWQGSRPTRPFCAWDCSRIARCRIDRSDGRAWARRVEAPWRLQ